MANETVGANHAIRLALGNGTTCVTPAMTAAAARYLARQIFLSRCYYRPGFSLDPSDRVIDVGAHIGLFTLWAAPQVPSGTVLAIEPNPDSFETLSLNITKNRLGNARPVKAAIGTTTGGVAEIAYRPGLEALGYCTDTGAPWFYDGATLASRTWWRLVAAIATRRTTEPVLVARAPRVGLGDLIDENRFEFVNFLKIDCEGSEQRVLASIESRQWRRIQRIVIEYHDSSQNGRTHTDLVRLLESNGFAVSVTSSWLCRAFLSSRFGTVWAQNRLFGHAGVR